MKQELIHELREKFEEEKNRLGFSATFEELEEIFFLQDSIASEGYVSEHYSRQLCARIRDTINGWIGYYHNILMPNPGSLTAMTEAAIFSDQEKQEMVGMINEGYSLTSLNSHAGLAKDASEEKTFIEQALIFWKEKMGPFNTKTMLKIHRHYKEKGISLQG
ncbi:MAG: hypothetical protein H6502_02540 [Candidatus Woesearchaeota archaeon]|nr:MAG: hypothetical protein H6502_02540 [Candidatus Woesearchaeota archaeon]